MNDEIKVAASSFRLRDKVFDTGEVCPKCGEHVMAVRMVDPQDGHPVLWKKPCACRNAEIMAEDAEKARLRHERAKQARQRWADIPDMSPGPRSKGTRSFLGRNQRSRS